MNQMSPISNKQSVRDAASPMIMSESSTYDQMQNPVHHEDWMRQILLKNADKLVKESKLTQKIKGIACQLGLANMKKSSIHQLRDGLIEYMRIAIEELVETSRSNRNLNAFQGKNLQHGVVQTFRCLDDSHLRGLPQHPVELKTICTANPKQAIEETLAY